MQLKNIHDKTTGDVFLRQVSDQVYLAGQPDQYANNWKKQIKTIEGFRFFDWETDADQTDPGIYFPCDLKAICQSSIMIANPGIAPSEAMWFEVGYFYSMNVETPGDFCERLIIIWPPERKPEWSIDFIMQSGKCAINLEEAKKLLIKLRD